MSSPLDIGGRLPMCVYILQRRSFIAAVSGMRSERMEPDWLDIGGRLPVCVYILQRRRRNAAVPNVRHKH
jgi:hypothetical protein